MQSGKASWRRSHPDPDGKPGRQKREKSVPDRGNGLGGWVLSPQATELGLLALLQP